ncbi:MAG: hydrogenase iron-sulfur subunit [Halanaerobiales bacterium]|nr:hydrogenase iron-sulfur subunit [Halanaerobiales bacterium]
MYDVVFIGDEIKSPKLKSLCIKPNSLIQCKGEIGDFKLKIKENDSTKEEKTKYIVINLKAKRENPIENTIDFTHPLEELDQKKDIVFIQDYEDISPAVINNEGLKKALTVKENYKDVETYYLYRSMRFTEENDQLYESLREKGVIFLQYEMDNIKLDDQGNIEYKRGKIKHNLTGQIITAPKLKPDPKIKKIARLLNIEMNDNEYMQRENIYLQPTLTGKRGVYALGGARGLNAYTDLDLQIEYTLNEIRSNLFDIEPLTDFDRVVDDQKCILCYTCYRVCPHGAVEEDDKLDAMQINELACYGCDACISHCPADAISYDRKEEEKKETETLKVMMCENSADTAFNKIDKEKYKDVKVEKIPCVSSIKKDEIFDYLRNKDSRLLILGCFEDSCKHLTGDMRGERIAAEVKGILNDLEMKEDRVLFERLSPRMEEDLDQFLMWWKEGGSK